MQQQQNQQNHFSIMLNNPTTTKASPPNMIALKKIQNYSYALTDQIGLGFTSHVYKGKNQLNNQQIAVKVIDLKNNEDELHNHFMNEEIIVLQKIKNATTQNLLRLQCVIKTKNNLYIITQFCQGKDMGKILRKRRKLSQADAHSVMKQLMKGFRELFSLNLIHRDLKLANLFITKGKLKIADFGFTISQQNCHQKMEYNVGSPYYMPPEALKYNRYSFKSDVWGMGVIAFQLVYGRVPWRDKNDQVLFQMMTTTPVQSLFDSDIRVSEQYKKFIIDCCTIDFNKRVTPEYIINYQWPLAKDFIDGIADEQQRHSSIGHPAQMRGINQTQVFFNDSRKSKEKEKQKTFHVLPRNRSPSLRKDSREKNSLNQNLAFRQSHPIPSKGLQHKDRTVQYEEDEVNSNSIKSQNALLGQIHYCRFMFSLYKTLERMSFANLIPELRSQLSSKINLKMQTLGEMVRTEKNLLKSPGFAKYVKKKEWENLKQIIVKYDMKFREQLKSEELKNMNRYSDETLKEIIREMKKVLPENWRILELLTFYFQLKQLEASEKSHAFYQRSKIQFLAGDSRRPLEEFGNNSQNCERLRKKLDFMLL